MIGYDIQEHRRYNRWQTNWNAKVVLPGIEGQRECLIKDLSFKGAKIVLTERLTEDVFSDIVFMFTNSSVINAEVWVAWSKAIEGRYVYGLYFSKIKDSDKQEIYNFIQKYYPQEIAGKWWDGFNKKGGIAMGTNNFEDRRIFERFRLDEAKVKFINLDSRQEKNAKAVDISAKGLGFIAEDNIDLKARLEIWLNAKDTKEPFYTQGEVIWKKHIEGDGYRVGVSLDKADLMGLARFLKWA